jgi:uncharacterized membrane protein YGL010W
MLISEFENLSETAGKKMSFKSGMQGFQDVFTIALMVVLIFAVFYSQLDLIYKVGIGVLVISIVFLTSIAGQLLRQIREEEKKRF